jgi:hypothetical protein
VKPTQVTGLILGPNNCEIHYGIGCSVRRIQREISF